MRLGKYDITTRCESAEYDPGWRSTAVAILREEPSLSLPPELAGDEYVGRYAEYVRRVGQCTEEVPSGYEKEHLASKWAIRSGGDPVKLYLEPLLLTSASYARIAEKFGVSDSDIRTYERLFFAVRADDGKMTLDRERRRRLAYKVVDLGLGDSRTALQWRVTAAVGDYNALMVLLKLRTGYWDGGPSFSLADFDGEGDLGRAIKKGIRQGVDLWRIAASCGGPALPDALKSIPPVRPSKPRQQRKVRQKHAGLWT